MSKVFRRRLHKEQGNMLSSRNRTPARHELIQARAMQKRRTRKTPASKYSQRIDVLNAYGAGQKLNICISRSLGGIGDVLMTTPTVRAIKIRFPNSNLVYATDPKYSNGALFQVLENNPYIDEIVPFSEAHRNKFDLYADLTSVGVARERLNYPPANRIDLFADFVGIDLFDPLPVYNPTKEEQLWARTMITKWTNGKPMKVLTIHISSIDERRNWPIQNYMQLVGKITSQYDDVFVIIFDQHKKGGWGIKNTKAINNYGIRQVAALIDASQLFIGPDSGLMHIAGALEKNMITLFGTTDPKARINHYIGARAIIDPGCQICWYSPCSRRCMELISVSEVFSVVKDFISSESMIMSSLGRSIIIDSYQLANNSSLYLQDSISRTIQITATPVLIGPQKNYLSQVNDIAVEMIDTSDIRRRKYPRSKSLGVITSLLGKFDEETTRTLNGYKHLLVGTPAATNKLKEQGFNQVSLWNCAVNIEPKPMSPERVFQKTTTFGVIIDKTTLDVVANLRRIIDAFREAFKKDIEKRLLIYVNKYAEKKIKEVVNEIDDMRITVNSIAGFNDLNSFFQKVDVYIEADPMLSFPHWILVAAGKGITSITPTEDIIGDVAKITLPIKTQKLTGGYFYDVDDLSYYLNFYEENKDIIDDGSKTKVNHVKLNHNKKESAHQLLLIMKNL